ncbi:MAG: hypothetical protein H7A46_05435 [Verrucomicrobiales bacterium]|nr:hypothetical protein [Verrucomicrobiales bacterium]
MGLIALLLWRFLPPAAEPAPRTVASDVFQGELPGYGAMTLDLMPGGSIRGTAFSQPNGDSYRLEGTDQPGSTTVALVAWDHDLTNGWLALNWPPRPAGFIEGTWQTTAAGSAVPVRFQRVSTLWQRWSRVKTSVATTGCRVTVSTEYPVFSESSGMESITRTLEQDWWRPPSWRIHPWRGPVNLVWSWFAPGSFKPLETWRQTEVLLVSDRLVVLATRSAMEVMPASADERLTWNFVKDGETFRQFELADLFRRDSAWVQRLSALCLKDLRPQAPEWIELHEFTAKDLKQFAALPGGLLIRFHPFGDPTEECPHVMIPWSRIQDMLNPEGPTKSMQRPAVAPEWPELNPFPHGGMTQETAAGCARWPFAHHNSMRTKANTARFAGRAHYLSRESWSSFAPCCWLHSLRGQQPSRDLPWHQVEGMSPLQRQARRLLGVETRRGDVAEPRGRWSASCATRAADARNTTAPQRVTTSDWIL